MKKEEICVLVDTDKKAKKVRDILIEAGEKIYQSDIYQSLIKGWYDLEYPYIYLYNGEWMGNSHAQGKQVSIKELQQMLIIERLKKIRTNAEKKNEIVTIEVKASDAPHIERLINALNNARIKHPKSWNSYLKRERLKIVLEESLEIAQAINDGDIEQTKAECIDRIVCYFRAVTGD